jgi:hypothetical protein
VSEPSVFVRVRDDAHSRIAWAVSSLPDVASVGMLGRRPPKSWNPGVVAAREVPAGATVCDPDPHDDGGIWVVAGDADRASVTHASIEGLAHCLALRAGSAAEPVWTTPGTPRRSDHLTRFPPPVGATPGRSGRLVSASEFAAAAAVSGQGMLACVDDREFMEAICMAAAVPLADGSISEPTPVWLHHERYLEMCEWLGLVIAETVSA